MGRPEVLKFVGRHLVDRPGVADRFLREIRSAAKLHHANIVTAYSALRLGESLVLAMEYVEGLDLAKIVKTNGPLPVAHACAFIHQAALGLQHAHERGMVHRDIKPANLILARDGKKPVVKVLDFGLAKETSEGQADGGLTREGQMLGTPDYIAPEQIRDAQSADIRADIYSLGCTLYYLLSGGPPFRGGHLWDLYQAHFSLDAEPLNLVRPEAPVELAAVVAKMMANEPARRFQQPKEVAQALAPFFKSGGVAVKSQGAELSQPALTNSGWPFPGAVSTPTKAATQDVGPTAAHKRAAKPPAPETEWKSLIDLRETEGTQHETPAFVPNGRPRWLWPSSAVGAMLLGIVVVWGVLIKIRTPDGTIVLADLPDQASVLIDGKKATINWPEGGGPAEISAPPGEHVVQVKKDGFTIRGQRVTVEAAGKKMLTVLLEPLHTTPGKDVAGNRPSRTDTDKAFGPRDEHIADRPRQVQATEAAQSLTGRGAPASGTVDTSRQTDMANRAGKVDAADRTRKEPAQPRATETARSPSHAAQVAEGKWRVEGRELVQSGGQGTIFLGDMTLSSFDLRFQGQIVSGNEGFVALFHYTDDSNLRFFHVGEFKGKRVDLGRLHQGQEDVQSKPTLAEKGRWYKVWVKVRGGECWCYLDGQESLHDVDERLTRGRIGLATWNASARFRDIAITTPEGRPLWISPPGRVTDSEGTVIWQAGDDPARQAGGDGQAAAERPIRRPSDKRPLPAAVGAGSTLGAKPPVGAVVLFNGKNTEGWVKTDGKTPVGWVVAGGFMTVGRGDIMTKKRFGDFELHLEFNVPSMPTARGQARGNSGVFLGGIPELQILDSYGLKPESNDCGAIYKQVVPVVNACKPPLQWQTYDVTFHKARVEQGKVVQKARVTVIQNGLKIIDDAEISPTPGGIDLAKGQDGPILLQDHGNRVEYRNIWIKPLN